MLNEFLVLGRIPGTGFQITFNELLVILPSAALAGLLYLAYMRLWFARLSKYARLRVSLFIESKKHRQLSLPL